MLISLSLVAGDLSKPVYRHLAERKWRKEGDLAILVSLPGNSLRRTELTSFPFADAASYSDVGHP